MFDPGAMRAPLGERALAFKTANGAPAVEMAAARGDRSAFIALGVDDIATQVSATTGQTFEIGSQTKMMTAVAVLQLVDEGLLDLDARLTNYLPASLTEGVANAEVATIRQILAMRSGIPGYNNAVESDGTATFRAWMDDHPGQTFGPGQMLAISRGMPAPSAPGGAWDYSNTGYLYLGLLIEAVTGEAWADVMESRVFRPAGMTETSARQFDPDPLRLSSYERQDGRLVDMTDGLWAPRGESGVVSTTADLMAFLDALVLKETLLSPERLAEMFDFRQVASGSNHAFGLGILKKTVGGQTLIGFTGGTLGTSSATWCDPFSGMIVSLSSTVAGSNSATMNEQVHKALRGLADWAPEDDGPLEVRGLSAAEIGIEREGDGLRLSSGEVAIALHTALRAVDPDSIVFADGSVLMVGDGSTGTGGDDAANLLDVRASHPEAMAADNRLYGLGGEDSLTGGRGDDRMAGGRGADRLDGGEGDDVLSGGRGSDRLLGRLGNDRIDGNGGNDRLIGGKGDDVLRGGGGDDRLEGRPGADVLEGGRGADVFRFDDGHSGPLAPDVILDFDPAADRIDLRPVDAVAGRGNQAFTWVGDTAFSGIAGELRLEADAGGLRIEGDTDGDAVADLAIVLRDLDGLSDGHFLL